MNNMEKQRTNKPASRLQWVLTFIIGTVAPVAVFYVLIMIASFIGLMFYQGEEGLAWVTGVAMVGAFSGLLLVPLIGVAGSASLLRAGRRGGRLGTMRKPLIALMVFWVAAPIMLVAGWYAISRYQDRYPSLTRAIREKDRTRVREVLDGPDKPKPRKGKLDDALHAAAADGDEESLRLLIENGADVNALAKGPMGDDWTPLHRAASEGRRGAAEILISHGADVNSMDDRGQTPLLVAIQHQQSYFAEMLLEKGADPNLHQPGESPPLEKALMTKQLEIFKLLVDYKADLNAPGDNGYSNQTVLHHTAEMGDRYLVLYLLDRGADPNSKNKFGATPLKTAAELGHREIVTALLEHGADPNIADNRGRTAITAAAEGGFQEIVSELMGKGAEAKGHNQREVVMVLGEAVASDNLEQYKKMTAKDNLVSFRDDQGRTQLHLAAEKGAVNIAGYLIDTGLEVDAKDNDKDTPLHKAVREGHLAMVQLLIDRAAEINYQNRDGETPMVLAEDIGENEIAALLKKYGGWPGLVTTKCRLCDLAMNGRVEAVRYALTKNPALIKETDRQGNTALHWAIIQKQPEAVEALIELGADLDAKNNEGFTPRDYAKSVGDKGVLDIMIKHGAGP